MDDIAIHFESLLQIRVACIIWQISHKDLVRVRCLTLLESLTFRESFTVLEVSTCKWLIPVLNFVPTTTPSALVSFIILVERLECSFLLWDFFWLLNYTLGLWGSGLSIHYPSWCRTRSSTSNHSPGFRSFWHLWNGFRNLLCDFFDRLFISNFRAHFLFCSKVILRLFFRGLLNFFNFWLHHRFNRRFQFQRNVVGIINRNLVDNFRITAHHVIFHHVAVCSFL